MSQTKPEPKAGDPCPTCGGELAAYREPTDAERDAAANRENPVPFAAYVDTASREQRATLGPLHQCRGCGYQTRIKPEGDDARASSPRRPRARGASRRPPAPAKSSASAIDG
jgi:hypothetical protein